MISGIILAKGCSLPTTEPAALFEAGHKSIIRHIVDALYSARVLDIVIVLDVEEEKTRQMLSWFEGKIVIHSHSAHGAMSSVLVGYDALDRKELHGAMICSAQFPMMSQSLLVDVSQAYWKSKKMIVASMYSGKRGYPVIMDQSIVDDMRMVSGEHDLESVLQKYSDRLLDVPTDDEGAVLSINAQAEFEGTIIRRGL